MGISEDLRDGMIAWDAAEYAKEKKSFLPGISGCGQCRGMRILQHFYQPTKETSGYMFRGKWFELMMRTVFPIGTKISSIYTVEQLNFRFTIVLQEQTFETQADMIVRNSETAKLELWDFKSTFISNVRDEGTDENIMQVNLAAYYLGVDVFRLIYADASNWFNLVDQSYAVEMELALEGVARLLQVESAKKLKEDQIPWETYCEGLNMIRYTPKKHIVKRPCDYCKVRPQCEQKLGDTICNLIKKAVVEPDRAENANFCGDDF